MIVSSEHLVSWRDGDIWRHFDAVPITAVLVTHWMQMPPVPGSAT